MPADPFEFWRRLHPNPTTGFFFGPAQGQSWTRASDLYFSAEEPTDVLSSDSAQLAKFLERIKPARLDRAAAPRFVGFFGFNAGRAFDAGIRRLPLRANPLKTPAALFGDFRSIVQIDLKNKRTILHARGKNTIALREKIQRLLEIEDFPKEKSGRSSPGKFQVANERAFAKMVSEAKRAIARGDIYQANLSLRFQRKFAGDPAALYRALCRKNPSPYSCLMKFGDTWIVSASPELLVRVRGRRVITRPIAGTRPRGADASSDRRRQGQLLLSPKERAEHVMLVDLERNDVGRVCAPGSVRVTESYAVERYSHVMHIVSQVEGRLASRKTAFDAVRALFPGGTITGCPKIKSIELIEKIERIARGPFYGSAGFFCENGDAVFNILIRTALVKNKTITIQAGAGIVADSNPKREYREILAKAGALLDTVQSLPS